MDFKIEHMYKATTLFEYSVAVDGSAYLIIYGKHINGHYCCIPNWDIGCEMGSPGQVDYNTDRLNGVGIAEPIAYQIAKSILEVSNS